MKKQQLLTPQDSVLAMSELLILVAIVLGSPIPSDDDMEVVMNALLDSVNNISVKNKAIISAIFAGLVAESLHQKSQGFGRKTH